MGVLPACTMDEGTEATDPLTSITERAKAVTAAALEASSAAMRETAAAIAAAAGVEAAEDAAAGGDSDSEAHTEAKGGDKPTKLQDAASVAAVRASIAQELHRLAQIGEVAALQQLLKDGAEADMVVKPYAFTAGHLAARHNQVKVLEALKEVEPKLLRTKDQHTDSTPLHWAASAGAVAATTYLLNNGAKEDVNTMTNRGGYYPIHSAMIGGSKAAAEALVELGGADVRHRSYHGSTPMHFAAFEGNTACVLWLLENGARDDVFARNSFGQLPLERAQQSKHDEVASVLEEHMAAAQRLCAVLLTEESTLSADASDAESKEATAEDGERAKHVMSHLPAQAISAVLALI